MIQLPSSKVRPGQPIVTALTEDGPARKMRTPKIFLQISHLVKLDKEILRRRAYGLDRDADGKRVNLNRSMIIRELIDKEFPD